MSEQAKNQMKEKREREMKAKGRVGERREEEERKEEKKKK